MSFQFTKSGKPWKYSRHVVLDDDGNLDLVVDGKEDVYGFIQSFKESCSIESILARFNNGDPTALSQKQGMYGDFTKMPKTYAEVLQMVLDGQNTFAKLPVKVKEEFDNDFNKWFASYGDETWFKKMGFEVQEKKPVENEVKE